MKKKKLERLAGRDRKMPGHIFLAAARLVSLGAAGCFMLTSVALSAAQDLPRTDADLINTIRSAIDEKDFKPFEQLVNWEGAGKIKRRIVRFEIRRGFGRKIDTIAIEDFPKEGMAKIDAMDQLRVNMPVTHRVRVTFDEPPLEKTGRQPTSVFLVGKQDGAYRIALVVRNFDDDDDD
ncbi:MAG: hypothetical protein ACR2Q4_00675 [Geminicoccaceae bacterium]